MRYKLSLLSLAIAGVALLAGAGGAPAQSAAPQKSGLPAKVTVPAGTVLRVADQGEPAGVLNVPWNVSGESKKSPLNIQWSNFQGGPPMIAAFQAGAIDLGWVADAPPINAEAAGQNVVIVGGLHDIGEGIRLMSSPKSSISSLAHLRGKKVGVQLGTRTDSIVVKMLQKAGLTPGKNVTLVNIPNNDVEAALESGSIDAGPLSGVSYYQYAKAYPKAHMLISDKGLETGLQWLITTKSVLRNPTKAAAIGVFLRDFGEALYWVKAHPLAYVNAEYVQPNSIPLSIAEKIYEGEGFTLPNPITPTVIAKEQALAKLLLKAQVITTPVQVKSLFNNRYNSIVASVVAANHGDTSSTVSFG